nr:MAG TPA_asm: hypothetical protein [Caudoviricetes sp.]
MKRAMVGMFPAMAFFALSVLISAFPVLLLLETKF